MAKKRLKTLTSDIKKQAAAVASELKRNTTRKIGKKGRTLFRDNFHLEGFKDGSVKKWKAPKRKDPQSKWYGFEYKGETRTSYAITKKGRKSKKQKKLNFSRAATTRKTLTGSSGLLGDSIYFRTSAIKIIWGSRMPYAQIHNEGGRFKVFGKHSAQMPQRKYMGQSKELNKIVEKEINDSIETALNI